MNPETESAFRAHAVAEYPRECCGLVVVIKGKEQYIECRNTAETPSEHFVLSAEDYADAEDAGEIVAVCHSHPNVSARASEADKVACEASGLPWHIAHVSVDVAVEDAKPEAGEMVTIEPCGYKPPLVGRPFSHGILDCYALVRDWYAEELGITLPEFERRDGWWDRGDDLYMRNFEAAGCERINGQPRRGDIILMQIRAKQVNHAAVYLGDGQILHHLHGRLSSRDIYGGYWQEVTRLIVRHKDAPNE